MGDGSRGVKGELEERVRILSELRPSHRKVLEFYGAVFEEQLKTKEKFHFEGPVTKRRATSQKGEEIPPLRGEDIPVDLGAAKRLFRSLCGIAKKQNPTLRQGVEKIERALRSRKVDLDRLLGETTLPETPYAREVSSLLGLSRDILVFLARASIQPFLEKVAACLGERSDRREWNRGTCPICGSPPIVSELSGEEGKRMWICSLCAHKWQGPRMACPFCNNEDQEAHRYLFVEGDETVRVDTCEACRKYIKTIDSRKMGGKPHPLLEYMGTLHLDVLAQEEGYQRGSAPFLEIS